MHDANVPNIFMQKMIQLFIIFLWIPFLKPHGVVIDFEKYVDSP